MQKLFISVEKLELRPSCSLPSKTTQVTWKRNAFQKYQRSTTALTFKTELKTREIKPLSLPTMLMLETLTQVIKEMGLVDFSATEGNSVNY